MSDSDLLKLYSSRILALAADIPHRGRLQNPDATARARSPLCGSTVTVDVKVAGDRITEFAQEVRACALGQASAAVFGASVIGLSETAIRRSRDQLVAMLKEGGPVPNPPFDALEALAPARDYSNRHASILLPFDATLEALAHLRGPRAP